MILLNLEAPTDILVLSFAGHTVIISAATTAAAAIQEWIRWVDRTYRSIIMLQDRYYRSQIYYNILDYFIEIR